MATWMGTDLVFLDAKDPEVAAAFKALAKTQGGDALCENKAYGGEVWQYMGTGKGAFGWLHEFRHRAHPMTNQRALKHVPPTNGWVPPVH